jgi:outer membrane protein TolC
MREMAIGLLACLVGCATIVEPAIPLGWPASETERSLTHADCVWLAINSVGNVEAWRARRLSAEAGLRQARTGSNPSFTSSWEGFGIARTAANASLEQTFSLSYAIEELLARTQRVAVAEAELRSEEAALLAERRTLTAEVWKVYDELWAARASIALREELLDVARSGLRHDSCSKLANPPMIQC